MEMSTWAGTSTKKPRPKSGSFMHDLVELSAADADKCQTLLRHAISGSTLLNSAVTAPTAAVGYEQIKTIRQRQKQLTKDEIGEMVKSYPAGVTVYQLAGELGCHRNTIIKHLKANDVIIRFTSPSTDQIHEMVRLYESGLSLAKVGARVDVSAHSVLKYLQERGIRTRDSHGRDR